MRSDQLYNPEIIDSYSLKFLQDFIYFLTQKKNETFPIKSREERVWESLIDEKWPYPEMQEVFSRNDRTALLRYLPKTMSKY